MTDRSAHRRSAWLTTAVAALAFLAVWLGITQAAFAAEDTFLEPDKAFVFSARPLDDRSVEVVYDIAPGYYLYREQFRFEAAGATLGAPAMPPGKVKFDETFRKDVETYRNSVRIVVPVTAATGAFRLAATSQGCADAGLCYPPQQIAATVSLAAFGGNGSVAPIVAGADTASTGRVAPSATAAPAVSETGAIESVLRGGSFWTVVGAFFVAGVLLSLTPCVLPMLPIVSSIIVGHGGYAQRAAVGGAGVSRSRGFALAASYSFGMAIVYTALGVAAGLAGEGLAATLQNPWVLGVFALGLVALSLSMFGVYEFRMPSALACRMTEASQRLPGGRVAGVCAMGGVSALIVSPCVAAPLAGALLYLSQTRDVWLGGTALFSLAAGMSVPLLLVGASAGALLPRAGPWMVEVKVVFGVLLLGVALWTVQPLLDGSLSVFAWGLLALGTAAAIVARAAHAAKARVWRFAVAALFGLLGVIQIVGAASGAADPLRPLAHLGGRSAAGAAGAEGLGFRTIKSSADLDAAIASSRRPVVLDFYADWCVSCKEMDRFTFADAAVQKRLDGALLLRADVTANDAKDRELLRRFRLFGRRARSSSIRAAGRSRRHASSASRRPSASSTPSDAPASERRHANAAILVGSVARWSSLVARWAHNPKVAGSNPALATTEQRRPSMRGPRRFRDRGSDVRVSRSPAAGPGNTRRRAGPRPPRPPASRSSPTCTRCACPP